MLLVRKGVVGWKMHPQNILGKPDFWFVNRKIAIFIDGCFWHGCLCRTHTPYANKDYWIKKLDRNKKRDKSVNRDLKKSGIKVLRIWEHEVKNMPSVVTKLHKYLGFR